MINNLLSRVDWLLVIPAFILVFLSLITLLSINQSLFWHQLIIALVSFAVFLFFSSLDVHMLRGYAMPLYILSFILLLIVLIVGIESRGAVRWIDIFGFRIQFSEILKPFLIICLASVLSAYQDKSLRTLGLILLLFLPIFFFIYRQPDLGSALIYLGVVVLTLIVYGFSWIWFVIGAIGFIAMIPVVWQFLHEYQKNRILTFLRITHDPADLSYNAIQAIIAVGSGMIWGKGIGQGTQSALKFLPERATDFLFATLSEDLGFIGSSIVILVFGMLLMRCCMIFTRTDDVFEKMIITASISLLFIQGFVNIGMNIGLLPIVGVTLPFVSYGGSSLLSNAIILGLISSISYHSARKNVMVIG